MKNTWVAVGALSAFIAVAAGAFGAHALRERLSEYSLGVWNTAAQYQMYHAIALVLFGVWVQAAAQTTSYSVFSGYAFLIGTVVFSGSLYALALTDIKWLGAITPLGGVAFLLGWLAFGWSAWRG